MLNTDQSVQIRGQRVFILKPRCEKGELPTVTVQEIENLGNENSDHIKKVFRRVTLKSATSLVNYLCREGITQHSGSIPV